MPTPGAKEVLVRVRAVAVTAGDARIRGANFPKGFAILARLMFGIRKPRRRVLGMFFSGVVESVGADVDRFRPGDEVCGATGAKMGAHADFVAVAADKLAEKPDELSHEDAAAVLFGGNTALYFLRDKVKLNPGAPVLVNGASGAVGTSAVQLARHLGARVTGVTSSANKALVAELGAERVIDYTQEPLAEVKSRYDVVVDTVGNVSIASGKGLLTDDGVLVLVAADLGQNARARGNVVAGPAPDRLEYIEMLVKLAAAKELRSVIDQIYDLSEVVAAHARVDSGHKVGNVILRP